MRTLLLGTDFSYTADGRLVPIEINTNVGLENRYLESDDELFDFTGLSNFITANSFTKLTYIGSIRALNTKLQSFCDGLNIEYIYHRVLSGNLTIPYVEDTPDNLIIRSAYDTTAIVDEVYCKNKINYLNLIKNKSFGSEFAYLDENGVLVNNITNIIDNGDNPNFILKSVYPKYNEDIYPKLYKVSNLTELETILTNVTSNHFLMTYHYNESKLYNNQVTVIRTFNLLFPPNLESIFIGSYKKFTDRKNDDISLFNPTTFEIEGIYRNKYITFLKTFKYPKLLDSDLVEMMDGTFKSGLDLNIGDIVKTIVIPNPLDVDLDDEVTNYHISYEEFLSGVTYSGNSVLGKNKVDRLSEYVEILFTDGTSWGDTRLSSYLTLVNNEIQFKYIEDLIAGDMVLLVNTSYENFTSVLKEVASISITKTIFSGWEITVDINHLFLTKTDSSGNESFATIEHNTLCGGKFPCETKTCDDPKAFCSQDSIGTCHCF